MSQGVSLGQALSLYTPEVSARSLTLIAAAERIGQLPATLHRLVQDDRAAVRRIDPTRVFYRWYPLLLLLAMAVLLSLLGIFIMPKFTMIFSDFKVPMPRLTIIVYALTRNAIPYVALALLLIILIFAGRRLWELRCGPRALPGRSIQDSFLWFFPLTRQAVTDRALADVCALAADALSLGRPLDRALDEAQGLDMNRILRRRIRAWNVHLHAGELPHTAAAHARLPRFFVGMLATAQAASNLPDVLSFLARYYAARFSRVLIFLQSAYTPIVVFIMALLVGAILLSVFLPIQRLIDAVAPSFGVF
jgi:type II secretory pathway component PulF